MNNKPDLQYPGIPSRPKNIDEMLERMQYFRSAAAREAVDAFITRPSDVFVATYAKSGTTWMQQIVHQARTNGDTGFDEISGVVPWIESAVDLGVDPSAEQPGGVRVFKSHLKNSELPLGGRYITVFRNPYGVLRSFYRFFEGWMFETGRVSLEEFAENFYFIATASGRHWDHFVDWWPKIHEPDCLALSYEDMLQAPDQVPALVAEFLGLEIDADAMQHIIKNCSRDYMMSHVNQFDDHLMRSIQDPVLGLPPGGDASKVTDGKNKVVLTPHLKQRMDEIWQEVVTPGLGFGSYDNFRKALPNPLGIKR